MAGWILKLFAVVCLIFMLNNPKVVEQKKTVEYLVDSSPISVKLANLVTLGQNYLVLDEQDLLKSLKKEAVLISSFDFRSINPFLAFRNKVKAKRFNDCQGEPRISYIIFDAVTNLKSTSSIGVSVDLCSEKSAKLRIQKNSDLKSIEVYRSGIVKVPLFNLEKGINCYQIYLGQDSDRACIHVREEAKFAVYGSKSKVESLIKVFPSFEHIESFSELSQNINTLLIVDVPAFKLNSNIETLKSFLNRGNNIVFLGGENSFSEGEYRNSDLEQILPVISEKREENVERAKRAIVVLVDKSGSMRLDNKLDRVRYALKLLVNSLKDDDYLGIIGFDTSAFISVPLVRLLGMRENVISKIDELRGWGGTDPTQALILAKGYLEKNKDASIKHIILLTDGEFKTNIDSILGISRILGESGITISGVLIGDEDGLILQEVTKLGKGVFYRSRDVTNVPEIIIKDVYRRVPKQPTEEKTTSLQVLDTNLREKFPVTPQLRSWNLTRSKTGAKVLVQTDIKSMPILAEWNYGKGVVKALPFDATTTTNKEFRLWNRYRDFLAFILGVKDEINFNLVVKKFGRYAILTRYTFDDQTGIGDITVNKQEADLTRIQKNYDSEVSVLFLKIPGDVMLNFQNNPLIPVTFKDWPFSDTPRIAQNTTLFDELLKYGYIEDIVTESVNNQIIPNYFLGFLFVFLWVLGSWIQER